MSRIFPCLQEMITTSSTFFLCSQASLGSEQVTLMKQGKGHSRTQASTSTSAIKESNQHKTKSTDIRNNSVNGKIITCKITFWFTSSLLFSANNTFFFLKAQRMSIKTVIQTEKIQQQFLVQTENNLRKKTLQDMSVQTEWVQCQSP